MSPSPFRRSRLVAAAATVAAAAIAAACSVLAAPAAAQGSAPAPGAGVGWGAGGLRVTPTRIVLEGRKRGGELTLFNTGSDTATYRISLVHMRMDESGALSEVKEPAPGEAFADSLVRFSPRQVELAPGEAQTVRVLLRAPPDLADGEYRSHLIFQAVPAARSPADSASGGAAWEVRIGLTPVFGVAIPLIVRRGASWAKVTLEDARLERPSAGDSTGAIALNMTRTGTRSVYGDLTVYQMLARGKPRVMGAIRGVAVYVPNASRQVRIPLQSARLEDLMRGALRVVYQDPAARDSVIAETSLKLP